MAIEILVHQNELHLILIKSTFYQLLTYSVSYSTLVPVITPEVEVAVLLLLVDISYSTLRVSVFFLETTTTTTTTTITTITPPTTAPTMIPKSVPEHSSSNDITHDEEDSHQDSPVATTQPNWSISPRVVGTVVVLLYVLDVVDVLGAGQPDTHS